MQGRDPRLQSHSGSVGRVRSRRLFRLLLGGELAEDLVHGAQDGLHHQRAVGPREVLGPANRLDVVVEVPGALGQVREIAVGQVVQVHAHVLLGELDEVAADPVAHAAGARVEHHPHAVVLVEADLDEVVARAQGAQVHDVVRLLHLGVLLADGDEALAQVRVPDLVVGLGHGAPRAPVAATARTGAPVGDGRLDRRAQATQGVGQVVRSEAGPTRDHAAADVHADGGRDGRKAATGPQLACD